MMEKRHKEKRKMKISELITFNEKVPASKVSSIFAFIYVAFLIIIPKRFIYPQFSDQMALLINVVLVATGWICLLVIDILSNKSFFTPERIRKYVRVRIIQLLLLLFVFGFVLRLFFM